MHQPLIDGNNDEKKSKFRNSMIVASSVALTLLGLYYQPTSPSAIDSSGALSLKFEPLTN